MQGMDLAQERQEVRRNCPGCIQGKYTERPHPPKETTRSPIPIGVVHRDAFGPLRTTCYGGGEYFVTFTDEYTRKIWVYVLRRKSEVYETVMEWVHMVERESGHKVKRVRSDNGGEYVSSRIEQLCKDAGIVQEYDTSYTPQDTTLMEKDRCMML